MADLFDAAAEARLRATAPLAARLRPRTIDEIVGQDHLVGPDRPLRRLVEADALTSVILWGPPGTGKTTTALAIAGTTRRAFEQLSAVTAGVKDVRAVIDRARIRLGGEGRGTILFLDEIHRFSTAQQDALLPAVEDGTLVLIGATTENPFFEVIAPLRSRSTLFRLEPLGAAAVGELVDRGCSALGRTLHPEARALLVQRAGGDGRQALTALEVAAALGDDAEVDLAAVEAALSTSALRYGRDDHYDVISAFIKSMRGSDPDAAVYWLGRMLAAGEDPRFIARRMIICASEDIGLADPTALPIAVAAAQAVDHVGLPEAQLTLAHAAIHLACAPKSNAATVAITTVRREIADGLIAEVPAHLRDSHYPGASDLGHGRGYRYPHDAPGGWVDQDHLPPGLRDRRWYRPTDRGAEREIAARLAELRSRRLGEVAPAGSTRRDDSLEMTPNDPVTDRVTDCVTDPVADPMDGRDDRR